MFQYLCSQNDPDSIAKWLNLDTNYLANETDESPIKLLSKATSQCVIDWLEGEDMEEDYNLNNIFLGIGSVEIKNLLGLAPEITSRFFLKFEQKETNIYPKVFLAELTDYPTNKMERL